GPCGGCHVPHNGRQARMWAREVVGMEDPVSLLCKSCHAEGRPAALKQTGKFSHPVGVQISKTGIKPIDKDRWVEGNRIRFGSSTSFLTVKPLPLFDEEGRKSPDGNVTCATCHNPHQWDPNVVKEGPGKDVEGDGTNSFLRVANNPDSALCRNCHLQRSVVFSKHNIGISAPEEKNGPGSKVSETGPCSACHLPHNGNGMKMWARKLGGGMEDPISQLCKNCHSKGSLAEKKTVGDNSHPLNVTLAKVGGESILPLFAENGVKAGKDGKVFCATCHNVHQWEAGDPNSTAGARKDVEGDMASSFLRVSPTPEGEICADCHKDKRFVKRTKHDLNISAPQAVNILGRTVTQSGTCGVCHAVHNSQEKSRLWARKMGEGDDIPEMRCRSCHALGEIAEKKMPKNFKHPKSVIASSVGRGKKGDFPLYNKEGDLKESGVITCPTCHNPHQWSAVKKDFGPGKMTEGDIKDSFLRNLSPSILCSDCHGLDSLFRYKYFHGDTSRKKYPLYGQ
ncbi:MAG TPA: cytochrome c3 family protein, partial [Thermodesulfobacteriota bacterium]|nr:cytochrome c3 family protein [Thermodesulfobacteriota bacterium]